MSQRLEQLKVLLIEDDDNVRETIKIMLGEMSIVNINEFTNGLDALHYIDDNQHALDLILCDWNLPQKTGLELLREVRQTHPILPFVMITARNDKESVMLAKSEKVTAYISKPIAFEALRNKINAALAKNA